MTMIHAKVMKFIADNHLFEKQAGVIVGLSGGADSMALLDILVQEGYRVVAAHCNFHLRGEASDADAAFTKTWCKKLEIEYISTDFDTEQYASDHKISIEMAARDLRYNWFETVRKQYNADVIAVAHHKDDSVETVLLNLSRGTGISGLRGILPKNGKVVRPLLCVNRDEIEQYLKFRKIPYRTDATNEQDIYRRNFIRLNIIPALQTMNPAVSEAIFRTTANLAEVEKVYRSAIDAAIAEVVENRFINIGKLKDTVSPQAVLFELLSPLGFSPSTIEDILKSLDAESGKQFFSNSHRIIKDREHLILEVINLDMNYQSVFIIHEGDSKLEVPLKLEIQMLKTPVTINKQSDYLYVDADKITYPLILRKWETGDWFIPFGMSGKKKVSDFFTDQKFSLIEKEETWLLFSGESLVWIVGSRSDDRFKITDSTQRVLKLVLKK